MRRFHVVGMVLVAILAIGAFGALTAAAHKKGKKVPSTTTMVPNPGSPGTPGTPGTPPGPYDPGTPGTPGTPPGNGSFSGKVGSSKAKCVRDRSVVVRRANGPTVGQAVTDSTGNWTVGAGNNLASGEQYSATVAKKKLTKENENHKHVTKCGLATVTITIP